MNKKLKGGAIKREFKVYASEIIQGMKVKDYSFINKLLAFSIHNKEFMYTSMYDKGKYIIPLDFDNDKMYFRITEKGTKGEGIRYNSEYSLYLAGKGNLSYKKYNIVYDEDKTEYCVSEVETITKRVNYSKIKEELMKRFDIRVKKDNDLRLLIKKCQAAYIIHLDKELEDISKTLNMDYNTYLKLVGNPSRSSDNDYELYRAYQRRVAKKYNEGLSLKEIYEYFDTSRDPVYRALKECNYLITDKEKFKELLVRSYAEGMTAREVAQYFKPMSRKMLKKEEYKELILGEGKNLRRSQKHTTESIRKAIELYRNGIPLHELVNRVRESLGKEEIEDSYWRQYTRYLIGLTEGNNGIILDYEKNYNESMEYIRQGNEVQIS